MATGSGVGKSRGQIPVLAPKSDVALGKDLTSLSFCKLIKLDDRIPERGITRLTQDNTKYTKC